MTIEKANYKDGQPVWVRARIAKHKARFGLEINGITIIEVPQQKVDGGIEWRGHDVLLKDVAPYGQARNKELEARLSALEQETEAQWHILQMHEYGLPGNYHYTEPEEDLYKGTVTGDEVINRMEAHSVGVRLPARNQKFGTKIWSPEEVENLCREAFAAHHQVIPIAWDTPGPWNNRQPTKADWRRAIVAVLYNLGLSNTPPHLYEDGQGLK